MITKRCDMCNREINMDNDFENGYNMHFVEPEVGWTDFDLCPTCFEKVKKHTIVYIDQYNKEANNG